MSQLDLKRRIRECQIVPVLTIHDADQAVDIARALIGGGIDVLEVTLRTDAALDAIENIKTAGLECITGAGTVTTSDDISACERVGADFIVTPATPREMFEPLLNFDGLVLPGAATPTEALTLYQLGFDVVKFFPAEAAGGVSMLKALSAPLPGIRFMPTGGISLKNASDYLALPNVLAIGGSWLCTDADVNASDWAGITDKARTARQLS